MRPNIVVLWWLQSSGNSPDFVFNQRFVILSPNMFIHLNKIREFISKCTSHDFVKLNTGDILSSSGGWGLSSALNNVFSFFLKSGSQRLFIFPLWPNVWGGWSMCVCVCVAAPRFSAFMVVQEHLTFRVKTLVPTFVFNSFHSVLSCWLLHFVTASMWKKRLKCFSFPLFVNDCLQPS